MKDILLIAHFYSLPNEKGNSRFRYLEKLLKKKGMNCEIITSSFCHIDKSQRKIDNNFFGNTKLVYEPSYFKNVSLRRIFSHHIFAKNIGKYLETRKKPDVIYCAVPSLGEGYVAAKYCKKNNIKFIVDVQDLWPEAFQMVFNIPILSNLIFYLVRKKANYIYSSADEIVAVSETYAKRALEVNQNCKNINSIFLGTELKMFDQLRDKNKILRKDKEIWICYVGTLGHSYNIECIIDAISILKKKGYNNLKFIILGAGPLEEKFKSYANKKKINSEFLGRLQYSKMVGILCSCDIGVNPILKGSIGSIINKVGDYAAAGIPVINTQECEEYRSLVRKYKCGFNCENNNLLDISNKLEILTQDKSLRKKMGENNRKLAIDKFDREKTYKKIVDIV